MARAAGVRIAWSDLPEHVRAGVCAVLGGEVVTAVSQPGGFSPGTADRVRTRDGRRAFVKAVHPDLDEGSALLHRREARISAVLPDTVPAPELLGTYDRHGWIALVFVDVEGRHPVIPWRFGELDAVLDALDRVAATALPPGLSDLPLLDQAVVQDMTGFARLRDDPPTDLDPWAREHLDQLCDLAGQAPGALAGRALVHADVRADNLLVRPDGSVALVDWPWAARGAPWADLLGVLIDVRLHDTSGEHDVDALLTARTGEGVDPDDVTAALAGWTGYFLDASRRPAPPGLPTLRTFQAAEGRAALDWTRQRLT